MKNLSGGAVSVDSADLMSCLNMSASEEAYGASEDLAPTPTAKPHGKDAESRLLGVLSRLETKIDVLNFKVDNLERRLDALSSHVAMPVDDDSYTWEELPVRSQEEFGLLEAKLKQDNYYKLALERRLMLIGGDSLRSCVKRILEVLLSHEVQLLFNWAGTVGRKSREQKPKLAFKNTEICPILTHDNSQSSSTTEEGGAAQAGQSSAQRGGQEAGQQAQQAQFRPSGDPHAGPMPQHPFFGSEGFGNHHLLNLSNGPLTSAMQIEHSQ